MFETAADTCTYAADEILDMSQEFLDSESLPHLLVASVVASITLFGIRLIVPCLHWVVMLAPVLSFAAATFLSAFVLVIGAKVLSRS